MRLIFLGTPAAAVPTLSRLLADGHEVVDVWTQPDRPAGRGGKLKVSAVKELALAHDLPVFQPFKLKIPESLDRFRSHQADAAIVVAYGRILSVDYLNAPKRGCINVHFSLLPKYRGAAPVNWAMVNGESETGVTTMCMDAGLDTGAILLQSATKIRPEETAPELMARLSETGAELLSDTLSQLDQIIPRPQDNDVATFAPILKREDGLIDWSMPAAAIEWRVRGWQPWPGAFTTLNGQRLVVWRAAIAETAGGTAQPGEILSAQGDELIVAGGDDTALRLLEVQPEGKRRLPVRDFLNGARMAVGTRLG
ncbi:MAG: methionyl-tRNA formyltransferase [Pyrinomonadaceae bacterium]